MKKMFTIASLLCTLTAAQRTSAQVALPYYSGFDSPTEIDYWQMYRLGATPVYYQWSYTTGSPFSPTQALYHGYPVGGTTPTDDWYVSPGFDFSAGATLDSVRRAFGGFGLPATADTVAVYLLSGSPDPALATTKTMLIDFRGSNYSNDYAWTLVDPVDIPATPGTSFIAFRYKTVANWLDVKFDNIALRSKKITAIDPVALPETRISCYPTPAKDMLYIKTDLDIKESRLFDLSGKLIYSQEFAPQLSLASFVPGTYILQSVLADGRIAVHRIVRQ